MKLLNFFYFKQFYHLTAEITSGFYKGFLTPKEKYARCKRFLYRPTDTFSDTFEDIQKPPLTGAVSCSPQTSIKS